MQKVETVRIVNPRNPNESLLIEKCNWNRKTQKLWIEPSKDVVPELEEELSECVFGDISDEDEVVQKVSPKKSKKGE